MITSELQNKVTQNVIAQMETHGTNWLKSWVGDSRMPINCETKKAYSGINLFILLGEEMTSHEWGTYKAWSRVGKQIRKGEKATTIVFFKSLEHKTDVDTQGNPLKIPMMKCYYVFNESQTQDYEVAPVVGGSDFSHVLADEWIQNTGAKIEHLHARAFYNPNSDHINMPPMKTFFATDDANAEQNYYGTLFHELTHWTGHASRCDRNLKGKSDKKSYAFEELVAELGACFQSVHFGIEPVETNPDHAKYLNSWMQALKDDNKFIFQASAKANKAIGFLNQLQDTQKVA